MFASERKNGHPRIGPQQRQKLGPEGRPPKCLGSTGSTTGGFWMLAVLYIIFVESVATQVFLDESSSLFLGKIDYVWRLIFFKGGSKHQLVLCSEVALKWMKNEWKLYNEGFNRSSYLKHIYRRWTLLIVVSQIQYAISSNFFGGWLLRTKGLLG